MIDIMGHLHKYVPRKANGELIRYFSVGISLHVKGLVEPKMLVTKLLAQLVDCKVSNQKSKTGMLWLHFTRYV